MAKTGGTPSTSFKIWEVPEEVDRKRLAHINPELGKWKSRVNEHQIGGSAEKQVPKMTKFPRRCMSKETLTSENPKKTPENSKISADIPKAPVKPRRTAKKIDAIPKRLEFSEAESENVESIDSGFGTSQLEVNHRYPTRARMSSQTSQNENRTQSKNSKAKVAKPRTKKNLPDFDKENDGSVANGAQSQQGTSSNKNRLPSITVNLPAVKNLATPEELNSNEADLSQCSSDDWMEHMRWLQQRRNIGVWIQCCRKKCGKWRYAEEYHDPLDVPKLWYCDMNADPTYADCSIPEQKLPPAEVKCQIENAYNAGSIVWARVNGYPWWPAMVDDCPDQLKYWDTRGSSIVPNKYHVKFFNEMKIAWMLVKDLKPYVRHPRNTFLKKTVFRRTDYTKQLDAGCELAKQALPLSIIERLEKFSWASQLSDGVHDNKQRSNKRDPSVIPDGHQSAKKRSKSTVQSKILTRKADNAVDASYASRSTKKQQPKTKVSNVINVRSRIINVDRDSMPASGPSISRVSAKWVKLSSDVDRSASDSQSQNPPSGWDKTSLPKPNELIEGSANDRNEVDPFDFDDGSVPNPPLNSTSTKGLKNPTCSYEKPRGNEPKNSKSDTGKKSLAEVVPSDIDDGRIPRPPLEKMSTMDLINLICSYQNPSLANEPTTSQYGTRKEFTNSGLVSARQTSVTTDNLAASQIGTAYSPSFAFDSGKFPPRVRRNKRLNETSAMLRSSIDATCYVGPIISADSFEDRGRAFPNDISAASQLPTQAYDSRSVYLEFERASSLQKNVESFSEGFSGGSEISAFGSSNKERASTSNVWELMEIDSGDSTTHRQLHDEPQDYPGSPDGATSRSSSGLSNTTYVSALNDLSSLSNLTRFNSFESSQSWSSVVPSSQPTWDEMWGSHPRFPSLCNQRTSIEVSNSSVSTYPLAEHVGSGS